MFCVENQKNKENYVLPTTEERKNLKKTTCKYCSVTTKRKLGSNKRKYSSMKGNKGDGDFKSQAYQGVVDKLRIELNISVTIDHVKNRIKVWKKHYATITDIQAYTKFKWMKKRKWW